jgi:serine/threonine protein phosphatase PrpC
VSKYTGFKSICRGFSHIRSDTECQDAVAYSCNDGVAVCAVGDGHGSDKYFRSGVGSEAAVEIAIEAVKTFMERQRKYINEGEAGKKADHVLSTENYQKLLHDLAGYIVSQWIDRVEAHWNANPCTEKEKDQYDKHFKESNIEIDFTKIYGSTLIIGVIAEQYGFIIQVGDGSACIIKQNGHKLVPSEIIDEEQYGGRTNSLSSSNCLSLFRFHFIKNVPKAIVIASDGVVDSYGGNDGKDFLNFCSKLVDLYSRDYKQAQMFVDDWLPQLSEKGSQDDMSVAGVFFNTQKTETNTEVSSIVKSEMECAITELEDAVDESHD